MPRTRALDAAACRAIDGGEEDRQMKALRFGSYGSPGEVLDLVEIDDPGAPGPGEVLVAMLAMAINPADILRIEGRYGAAPGPLPAIPGSDGVGRVVSVGEGVSDLAAGDLVMPLAGPTFVERLIAPAGAVVKLPDATDPLQAAMLKVNPATAWITLNEIVALEEGDWLIQNAANSAVGLLVARFARERGIRTVNVVRRLSAGRAVSEAGGDVILVHETSAPKDFARDVARATKGAPVKLALDAVGGQSTNALAHALAPGGVIASYGMMSGRPCEIDPEQLVFRNLALTGFWLAEWFPKAGPQAIADLFSQLTTKLLAGEFASPVEAVYPLEEGREAVVHASRGARSGKVLLTTSADLVRR
jgi:mitochondrial enoyl-[acyl-carrier protein] reductase / trans-2-enoyl-CoA reductase